VFPARYELNSYIVFSKRLVSKRLNDALDNSQYCSAAFLDISQAFDKVSHKGLLYKLRRSLPLTYYLNKLGLSKKKKIQLISTLWTLLTDSILSQNDVCDGFKTLSPLTTVVACCPLSQLTNSVA
jgi:hypothetical protein